MHIEYTSFRWKNYLCTSKSNFEVEINLKIDIEL